MDDKCFCDRMYPDSNPNASCGDCPTRDYKADKRTLKRRRDQIASLQGDEPGQTTMEPATATLCDLCHELWGMAQGPDPISQAVARMETRLKTWMTTYQTQPRAVPAKRVVEDVRGYPLWLSDL